MADDDVLLGELDQCARRRGSRSGRAGAIARAIRAYRDYRWVGVYDVGEEIAVLNWAGEGAPTHLVLARHEGLCGAAVASGTTINVADVTRDPRYLTTFGSTRSEIIVPAHVGDVVRGLIDVESRSINAFDRDDQRLLERCAAAIAPLFAGERGKAQRSRGSLS